MNNEDINYNEIKISALLTILQIQMISILNMV